MSDTAAEPRSPGSGPDAVDSVLDHCARKTGAYAGAVYVLSPDGQVLQLAVLSGISRRIASPWARVPLQAASPVSDAVRQGVLVWIGSQEELARRYPQLALVLPHPFALVAAPISTGARTWGGLVLHWSSAHPPTLGTQERAVIADACGPGIDIEEAITAFADQLAHAGDQPMDALAGTLITHARHTVSRSDDVALLLISPRRDM
ncbi:hypothetical protein [Streptomyces sp. NPDC017673]|uniref:hypothetical protein n=1 Tax=unclassified Streptomyces TaxID=2593676 RepID=UPI0037AC267E